MNALRMSSLLTCPRDPPSRRRSRSHVTAVRTSRGRCRVHLKETLSRSSPMGSAVAAAGTSPSCAPHGAAAACVSSGSDAEPLPPRRRARLRDPPSRACPQIRRCATDAGAAAAVAIVETDGTTVVVTRPRVRCRRPSTSRAPSPLARLPQSVVFACSWWSAVVGRLPRGDTAAGP
jgi:hypothetical protein